MDFEEMTVEEYRQLDLDALKERRSAIVDALDDTEVDTDMLDTEAKRCEAEFARRDKEAHLRNLEIEEVRSGKGEVLASNKQEKPGQPAVAIDTYDTEEYRNAFMEYVCRGTALPTEYRAVTNKTTTAANNGAVIPTTVMHDIIREMDTYGDIWNRVRKTNLQGGIEYPLLDLKPTATWITADAADAESGDQEIKANTKISFSYYGLECKVAQTLLASVVTFSEFQSLFVQLATEAMIKALEAAIISGSGSGQMLGITKDTRVPTDNKIPMTAEQLGKWAEWHKCVKAKMKKAYRNGVFIIAQSSFDAYIDGMVDTAGQPVGRTNYGINGEETYRFMGKDVLTVEDDLIADFDTTTAGDVIGLFVDLSNYCVNSNMQMRATRWEDFDKNVIKDKLILIADGKLVDPYGVLVITKKASA